MVDFHGLWTMYIRYPAYTWIYIEIERWNIVSFGWKCVFSVQLLVSTWPLSICIRWWFGERVSCLYLNVMSLRKQLNCIVLYSVFYCLSFLDCLVGQQPPDSCRDTYTDTITKSSVFLLILWQKVRKKFTFFCLIEKPITVCYRYKIIENISELLTFHKWNTSEWWKWE